MNFNVEIKNFAINGFKYHRWAGSLKSSQAFAYNVFSGVSSMPLEFEFPMAVFDRDAHLLTDSKN